MLFSEPKIPQCPSAAPRAPSRRWFQCSSASRKFLNRGRRHHGSWPTPFQCSSASRKFLNTVAMISAASAPTFQCSSASRKFLNGRYRRRSGTGVSVSVLFSEPKIPQSDGGDMSWDGSLGFSALQRAENSSIHSAPVASTSLAMFQCSSASRKFLNLTFTARLPRRLRRFSALQRAENSSILRGVIHPPFSLYVSVLFSEPKIPQFWIAYVPERDLITFQCSSASRKFLNLART